MKIKKHRKISAKKQKLWNEEPNENCTTKQYNYQNKNLAGRLNIRVEMTEDRINELEDRSEEFTQSEQRENRLKTKMSQRPVGQ